MENLNKAPKPMKKNFHVRKDFEKNAFGAQQHKHDNENLFSKNLRYNYRFIRLDYTEIFPEMEFAMYLSNPLITSGNKLSGPLETKVVIKNTTTVKSEVWKKTFISENFCVQK